METPTSGSESVGPKLGHHTGKIVKMHGDTDLTKNIPIM